MAKILIADDDSTLRDMLRAAFERDGHEVSHAADGNETVERIRETAFDLVLLDISLPDKSGPQVLAQLKAENSPIPPTMILSSKVSHELVRQCLDAGARDFVIKPFNLPVLVQRAAKLIEGKRKPPVRH
ncbi:MAG: response regulator transcription factor [Candidatus Tectomicrobia bacterium]|nr:response regulator transcription factor [Candidatus Tectomicrobia bacterium]MBI3025743.1 response regulator transcription factor [Candidatus Tectomicrobia bacterium]